MYDDSFEQFLMEEYLDGPELSVESLTYEGRHVIVAITDYVKGGLTGFAEIGMSYPSPYPAETQHEIKELVTDFLDAVGLRNGPAHTEVKLTSPWPADHRVAQPHRRLRDQGDDRGRVRRRHGAPRAGQRVRPGRAADHVARATVWGGSPCHPADTRPGRGGDRRRRRERRTRTSSTFT